MFSVRLAAIPSITVVGPLNSRLIPTSVPTSQSPEYATTSCERRS